VVKDVGVREVNTRWQREKLRWGAQREKLR